ncbi:InlB B-repeat-containing protein, partial [Bifidobacterium panos]
MVRFSSQTGMGRGLPRWLAAMVSAIVSALVVLAMAVPGAWAAGSVSVSSWADALSALTTADTVTYTVSKNEIPGATLTVPDGKTLIVTGSGSLTGGTSGSPLFSVAENGHLVLDGVTIQNNTVGSEGAVSVAKGGTLDLGSDTEASPSAPSITRNTTAQGDARNLVVAESATVRLNAEPVNPIGLSYAGTLESPVSMIASRTYTVQDTDLAAGRITADDSSLTTVVANNQVILRNANAKILYWSPNGWFGKSYDESQLIARQDSNWDVTKNRFYGIGDITMIKGTKTVRQTFVGASELNGLSLDQFDFIYIEPSQTQVSGKYYTQDEIDVLTAYLDKGGRIFIQCEDTNFSVDNASASELAGDLGTGFEVLNKPMIPNDSVVTSRKDSLTATDLTNDLADTWKVYQASPISYDVSKANAVFTSVVSGTEYALCVDLQAGSSEDGGTAWGNVTVMSDGDIWQGLWNGRDGGTNLTYTAQFAKNLLNATMESRAVAATGANPNEDRYEVTFSVGTEAADAGVVAPESKSVYKGSKFSAPTAPAYEGHALVGWYYTDDQGEEQQWDFNTDVMLGENLTLTAHWTDKASYTVEHYRLNVDGSTPLTPSDSVPMDPVKIGSEITADDVVTMPLTGEYEGFEVDSINTPVTVAADGSTKVFVYYAPRVNEVSFSVDAAKGSLDDGTVTSPLKVKTGAPLSEDEDKAYVKDPTVTPKAGWKFLGWRQQAESDEDAEDLPVYSPAEMATQTVKSKTTFDAVFEALPDVTVVFDYNGGTLAGDESKASFKSLTGAQGTSYAADMPDKLKLTRTGYTLDADKTWQSSSKDVTPDEATFTAAATFTAVWTANENTVTFDEGDHGTIAAGAVTSYAVSTDAKVGTGVDASKAQFTAPPSVTDDAGWTFSGWRCSEDNKLYASKDVKDYVVKGLDEKNKKVTFTAEYVANAGATVVFNPNGGQIDKKDDSTVLTGLAGESYAADVPADEVMSRDGYTFGGWQDSAGKAPSGTFVEGVTVYTAQWNATSNEIKFIVEDGDGTQTAGASTLEVPTGSALGDAEGYPTETGPVVTPVAGKVFKGWKCNGVTYQPDQIAGLLSRPGMTFTAVCEDLPEVTVTFDYNGGTLAGNTSSEVTERQNTTQAVPQPTRSGYTLDGWKAVPSSAGDLESTDKTVTLTTDAVYTAQWKAGNNAVRFYVKDHGTLDKKAHETLNVATGQRMDTSRESYAEPSVDAEAGWKFLYWQSYVNGKAGASYQPSQIGDVLAEPGLSFEAVYQELGAVTATLNYNGGHNAAGDSSVQLSGKENTAYSDADKAKAAEVPTRDGYTFAGWDTDPSGKYENASYIARWTANENTVTFVTDERGTLSGTTQYGKVKTGSAVSGKPDEPKANDGYRFTGWRCDEDGRLYSHDSVDKYVVTGANTGDKAKTVTFTAEYVDLDDVQVYFNYNGGRVGNETSGTLSGQAGKSYAEADVPTPTRTGYTFDKWDETPSLKYESVMYTAKWNVVENTVTFDKGDHGTLQGTTEYKVNSGDKVSGEPTAKPVDGWTFVGWKCDADQKVYAADGVKDKYVVTGVDGGKAQQVTFTALYEKNDGAKVVFNANGGLVGTEPVVTLTGTKGTAYTTPDKPERDGYDFVKWVDADDKEPTKTFDTDTTVLYTAQWTAKSNTLSFERGENNGQISGSLSYQVDTDAKLAGVTAPSATPNAGYSFAGWQSDEFGLVASDQLASLVMPAHDVTMTAVWNANPTGTVVFNFNGGHNANNESSAKVSGPLNTKYETPADPTREGWTFDGWDAPVSGTFDETTLVVNAKWTEARNKLAFVAGDHGSLSGTTGYEVATNANLKDAGVTAPNVTVEQGYEFIGWQSDKLGLVTTAQLASLVMPAGDVTFTAQYKPLAPGVVVFAYNGGQDKDGSASKVLTGTIGSKYDTPANPTRTGYTFTGWDRNVSGTFDQSLLQVNATWKANTYKLTYKLDGGSDPKNPTSYTYGVGVASLKNPTREGYTFAGWADQKGNLVSGISASDTGDKTLTAKWTKNASTDGLNPDGGTIPSDWTGADGQLPIPTRPGYKFDGWFDEDGNQVTTLKDAVGKNLTAKWTKIDDAFDPGDGTLPKDWTGADGELPTPTLPGYKFDGWYDEDGNLVTTVKDAIGKKLTAHWTKIDDAFDPQGGTLPSDWTGEDGDLPTPTRPGYRFDGWYDEDGNRVTTLKDAAGKKLTAHWTKLPTTFDVDGDVTIPDGWTGED